MKKFLAGILAATLCAGAICGFAGCSKDEGEGSYDPTVGREVSEKEWEEILTSIMNADEAKNLTCRSEMGYTYGKEQAEEYGEWSYYTSIEKYDKEAQIYYSYTEWEDYVPATSTEEAYFDSGVSTEYIFSTNGKYYRVSDDNYLYEAAQEAYHKAVKDDGYTGSFSTFCDEKKHKSEAKYPWLATELTKAQFITEMEVGANLGASIITTAELYADLYSMLEYQEDTGRYKIMSMGSMSMEIGIMGNGFQEYTSISSIQYMTDTVYDVDATSITVPDEVLSAIAYISAE